MNAPTPEQIQLDAERKTDRWLWAGLALWTLAQTVLGVVLVTALVNR